MISVSRLKRLLKSELFIISVAIFCVTLVTLPSYFFGKEFMYLNHDRNVHPIRLWHVENALYEGLVLPNWITTFTNELGSPVFLFNWFIPYYMALIPRVLGFNLADSIKLIFLASYIFSGYSFYVLSRTWFSKSNALVATIFFLTLPYRFTLIFVRGALGEAVALSILPLFLYYWVNPQRRFSLLGTTLTTVLLITSHNVVALYAVFIAMLWLVFKLKSLKEYLPVVFGFILGVALTTFFWLPSIYEKNLTHIEVAQKWSRDHFVDFEYLFTSPWRKLHGLPHDLPYGMSLNLGITTIFVIVTLILFHFNQSKIKKKYRQLSTFLFIGVGITIFLQTTIAKPIWETFTWLSLTIFPWRLQAITTLFLSLMYGCLGTFIKGIGKWTVFFCLITINLAWLQPWQLLTAYEPEQTFLPAWHDGSAEGEFLPRTADRSEYKSWYTGEIPPTGLYQIEGNASVENLNRNGNQFNLELTTEESIHFILNHYYFPGWKGTLDTQPLDISHNLKDYKGRINFKVSPGKHRVTITFVSTPIRKFSQMISAGTLLLTISYLIYGIGTKYKRPDSIK